MNRRAVEKIHSMARLTDRKGYRIEDIYYNGIIRLKANVSISRARFHSVPTNSTDILKNLKILIFQSFSKKYLADWPLGVSYFCACWNLSKAEPRGTLQSRYSKHLTDYKPYSMSNIEKLKKEIKNYKPKSWKHEIFSNQLIADESNQLQPRFEFIFIWANPDKNKTIFLYFSRQCELLTMSHPFNKYSILIGPLRWIIDFVQCSESLTLVLSTP